MLKFKICLAILLSCSFNANANENRDADCGDLYTSFYSAIKRDLNIDDLAQKRDESYCQMWCMEDHAVAC